MKEKLHPHKLGLVLGTFMGFAHAVWSLLVALDWAKPLVDWILSLHFLIVSYSLATFNLTNAVILVVVTAVWGYIVGYVFAMIWNWAIKSKL